MSNLWFVQIRTLLQEYQQPVWSVIVIIILILIYRLCRLYMKMNPELALVRSVAAVAKVYLRLLEAREGHTLVGRICRRRWRLEHFPRPVCASHQLGCGLRTSQWAHRYVFVRVRPIEAHASVCACTSACEPHAECERRRQNPVEVVNEGTTLRPLDVIVRRRDGTSMNRRRVLADPDDISSLVSHMICIACRVDMRTRQTSGQWVGDYELDVYEVGGLSPLFTVSSPGDM
jgi:hypothetical protein